ncbi:MAG: hypothetical protein ACOYEV_14770 [Candidatus Nanopelagicales bacterium]
MRDALIKRAAPAARSAEGDQETYFRLSLFSAEKTRLLQRLEEIRAQQAALQKRLELVDGQMQKLQDGLGESATSSRFSNAYGYRWNEVELEY